MYIKKLFFPGEFDDAYIYMQKLMLLNADGSLFYVDIDRVVRELEKEHNANVKSISTHLFARNDWFVGERYKSMFLNASIRQAFLQSIDRLPDLIEIEKKHIRYIGDIGITDLLDVTIYNKRLYMGTDSGTYHIDLIWNDHDVEIDGSPEKRHDAMCTQVNVKYGSVSISCGDDGLFTRFDEFGFIEDQSRISQGWQEAGDKSYRTSWLFNNLLNYTSPTEPLLLRVRRSDKTIYPDREARNYEKVAVGFAGEPTDISYLLGGITGEHYFITSPLLFLFNSYSNFYAQTQERMLFEVPIKQKRNTLDLEASKPKSISSDLSGRILDVLSFKRRNTLELYDSVKLLADSQLYMLAEGEALSMRSYPHSKRYQNLITIVVEGGVYVISVFDESEAI